MVVGAGRGLLGLASIGWLYLMRSGFGTPDLSNHPSTITPTTDTEGYHAYANQTAIELGIHKEIIVIKTDQWGHIGSNLFSSKAVVKIDSEESKEVVLHMIRHELIHFKRNDYLTWTFVPIIIAIFTNMILHSRFPVFASIGGLGAGVFSLPILRRWTEKQTILTTIQLSSKENNKAVRDWYQKIHDDKPSKSNFQTNCSRVIRSIFNPSPSEVLSYFQNHLRENT